MQDHVLTADPFGRLAGQVKLDGGGHLKPCLTGSHAGCHVCAANARGESAQGTVSTGMGICADDHITCHGQPFFRQKGMFNPHLSHFKIICDLIFACKLPHALTMFSRFDIFIGDKVIRHQRDLILVEHTVNLHFFHFLDRYGAGNIVAQHQIKIRLNELPCFYFV